MIGNVSTQLGQSTEPKSAIGKTSIFGQVSDPTPTTVALKKSNTSNKVPVTVRGGKLSNTNVNWVAQNTNAFWSTQSETLFNNYFKIVCILWNNFPFWTKIFYLNTRSIDDESIQRKFKRSVNKMKLQSKTISPRLVTLDIQLFRLNARRRNAISMHSTMVIYFYGFTHRRASVGLQQYSTMLFILAWNRFKRRTRTR